MEEAFIFWKVRSMFFFSAIALYYINIFTNKSFYQIFATWYLIKLLKRLRQSIEFS